MAEKPASKFHLLDIPQFPNSATLDPHRGLFWNASRKQSSQQHSTAHVPVAHNKKGRHQETGRIYFRQRPIIRKFRPQLPSTQEAHVRKTAAYLNLFTLNITEGTTENYLHSKSVQSEEASYFRQRCCIVKQYARDSILLSLPP